MRGENQGVLKAYLKERAWLALLLVLLGLIVLVVLALYGTDLRALGYAGLLCLLPLGVALSIDLARFRARHQALIQLLPGLPESAAHLPAPNSLVEQDNQALFLRLHALYREQATQADARHQAMATYFTLWSHQVKTPIAAMRLLLQEDTALDRRISGELFKVSQYVDMALGYARLDGRASDFVFAKCQVLGPVSATARRFAALFVSKRLSLQLEIPQDVRVVTDEKWLSFLLEQLLSNAIKYTESGGIFITWEEERKELVIKDTGRGILPEDLPRVFEMGFTGFNGRVDQQATGIGLYLARETARRLGLSLRLDSTPGQGTRAVVGFPREELIVE
jgi:hypothetical protein